MSTDIEKLRALLAEAREALVRAENRMMSPPHQVPEAVARIDAALAEPMIAPTPPSLLVFSDIADGLKRERDEARAEVERAYQRGAEAMRGAAATLVRGNATGWASVGDIEAAIRALPVPEDKR
jgi:hypothetical protein